MAPGWIMALAARYEKGSTYISWDRINTNVSMFFACTQYSFVLILHIPAYLAIKRDLFFLDLKFFYGSHFMYKLVCTTIRNTCPILCDIECIEYIFN